MEAMASLKVRLLTMVAPHSIRVQADDVDDSQLRPEPGTGTGGYKLQALASSIEVDPGCCRIVSKRMTLDLLGQNCTFISGS